MTSTYPHCPTASHLSSLTRHFVVEISRMEVIAHARTSSNDRRSHQCDTGISNEYVINFYCPFGPPPLILSLACDTILILSQEALFCYPHHFRLLYSPQHSWGIRLFIQDWRQSILLSFGYDPLCCSECGTSMLVLEVYHKKTALFERYRKVMKFETNK